MEVIYAQQTDVFGPNGIEQGWTVTVTYTDAEMADLLANYDAASGASPGVTYCRPTMRAMLDAVKEVPGV